MTCIGRILRSKHSLVIADCSFNFTPHLSFKKITFLISRWNAVVECFSLAYFYGRLMKCTFTAQRRYFFYMRTNASHQVCFTRHLLY
uniref:Secreted protein n=1 Tax=Ascaris lumbricoides TaxID=6252 RepID=A0A0M3I7U4_ASCLU